MKAISEVENNVKWNQSDYLTNERSDLPKAILKN